MEWYMGWLLLIGLCILSGYIYWHLRYNTYWKIIMPAHYNEKHDVVFTGKLITQASDPYHVYKYRLYITKEGFFIITCWDLNSSSFVWWKKCLHSIELENKIQLTNTLKRLFRNAGRKYPEFLDLVEDPVSHPIIDELEKETKAAETKTPHGGLAPKF